MPRVVAASRTKHGGTCQHCERRIAPGEFVCKVDVGLRGPQTSAGNGQGEWWCQDCATDPQPGA